MEKAFQESVENRAGCSGSSWEILWVVQRLELSSQHFSRVSQ